MPSSCGMQSRIEGDDHMNYGKISKQHAFKHGAANPITSEQFAEIAGQSATPKRLEKANERREQLVEQLTKKWKLDEAD